MGGWKTRSEPVLQTIEVSSIGAAGTALSSEWTMMWGVDAGFGPSFTVSPRDINNSGGNTAEVAVGRVTGPRFALNTLTVPHTKRVRFSCWISNVSTSNVTALLVTDPSVYSSPTSDPATGGFGVLYPDRNINKIVAAWGGTQITTTYAAFHNPGSDEFVLGIEFLRTEVNFYYYPYVQPVDTTTRAQIFDDRFLSAGTIPYKLPDVPNLYIGGIGGNAGDDLNQFLIEVLEGDGVMIPGQFHLPPLGYGLYKSQLQLYGLLNNAKVAS